MMRREVGDKEDYDRVYTDIDLLRRFWLYLNKYLTELIIVIIAILVSAVVSVLPPQMVQFAFDALEAKDPWNVVSLYAIGYVILSILLWIIQVFMGILIVTISQKIIKKIQMETYESLQTHDLSFYDKQSTGRIMSRVTNDSQELSNMIGVVSQFISNFAILFTVLIVMFVVNWRLTLISMAMSPFVFGTAILFRAIIRKTSGGWRAAIGEVNASFQESVSGISVAKAFGREEKSKAEFEVINDATYHHAKRRAIAVTGIWPIMDGISITGVFAITAFGSWLIFENLASASTILLFLLLLNRFLYPLVRVASEISTIQSGFAAMERIFSVIDAEKTIVNPENPVIRTIEGEITFSEVNFHYDPTIPVLKNINLTIEAGETIAIVGHTGAGKTTIASLLLRFYDIAGGKLAIDGVNIKDYDIHSLRSQIGLVSQDVFLFSGTVLENIVYGKPYATIEEVEEVIKVVAAQEFIDALPDGLKTVLGERGKGLSAGQRQMISFARALLSNPKILILDEATAAVDAYTEWKIQEALEQLLVGRTSIVIAHRLTTVKNANRIIVLDQGRIVEEGNHNELIKQKGLYSELYETYFKHQSAEWISEISDIFSD